jgi:hypothetical protein
MGCGEPASVAQSDIGKDAIALCQSYALDNWNDIDNSISFQELDVIVANRVKSDLKTDAVKAIVDEINNIEFYRNIYPHVKSKVEELTKGEWNCPELETFYSFNITKYPPDNSSLQNLKKIVITTAGEYLFNGKAILLVNENLSKISSELSVNNEVPLKVQVVMEPGTNDQQLEPLFKILADLGVENVSVQSDE